MITTNCMLPCNRLQQSFVVSEPIAEAGSCRIMHCGLAATAHSKMPRWSKFLSRPGTVEGMLRAGNASWF